MKTLLYLDDHRDPKVWLNGSSFMVTHVVVWVKSYDEFVEYIVTSGLPDVISFDHDLGNEHYDDLIGQIELGTLITDVVLDYDSYEEETGYDAAKWLVKFCDDNGYKLPHYLVHSANAVGAENIRTYLENAKKHLGI